MPSPRSTHHCLSALMPMLLAAAGLVSCTTDSVAPDGNIFLNRQPPKYGHGGTDSPRYKYGDPAGGEAATDQRRGDTEYLSGSSRRRAEEGASNDDPGSSKPQDPAPPEDKPADQPQETASTGGNDGGSSSGTEEPKPKPPTESLPYATPVPGKPGFVYSPYTSAGYVDVSGMPAGSKARCPYTKKVFRVP